MTVAKGAMKYHNLQPPRPPNGSFEISAENKLESDGE